MAIKILIVDDEPINVKLIEEILEYENDFQYRSAANGEEGLKLLDEFNADIIVLDVMMPGISGYEVCRTIKSDKNHKFAKVLMVSGKAMIEERLEGYKAGADDYITKPFVDDELLAKLKVFSKLKQTEELDELKTIILQLFSHETKTPLNGILLGSQLILDTPSLPDKITELAQVIHLSGERLHELVRKILLLSSLKNNKVLNTSRESVRPFLQDITNQTNSGAPGKAQVHFTCPSDFTLDLDWELFNEAFQAVVENAVKYSPAETDVEMCVFRDPSGVSFKVIDKGPGITPGYEEKIFDEFYSQHIAYHTKGTALSLAIGKKIMQLHQGELHAESTLGEGSTFIFTLPAALAED